jgi:hypothetical protein
MMPDLCGQHVLNLSTASPISPFTSADGFALPSPPVPEKLEGSWIPTLAGLLRLPFAPSCLSDGRARGAKAAPSISEPEGASRLSRAFPAFPPLLNVIGCVGLLQRRDCHARARTRKNAGLSHHFCHIGNFVAGAVSAGVRLIIKCASAVARQSVLVYKPQRTSCWAVRCPPSALASAFRNW